MANPHICGDTSSDSNLMHHIAFGLYVVGTTLVCLLGILLDIFFGFRSRKRWLPCRFFSLNSITLTLLSGALKLSVDLSTKMPSAEDQLSKLTGTTMLCICMAFLLPSLGINSDHEWWSNMAAMSILVATVVANIGIQLKTSVIFAFHVEHIIILCIMVALLLMMWFSAYEINTLKRNFMIQNRRLFSKGDGTLFERLKLGYLHYYNSNPQFLLCKHPTYAVVGALSATCVVILIKTAFYSLLSNDKSQFCKGSSNYKWSISYIVIAQIITVLVGTLGITFRWLTLSKKMSTDALCKYEAPEEIMMTSGNRYLKLSVGDCLIAYLKLPIYIVVPLMQLLFIFQAMVVAAFCKKSYGGGNLSDDQTIQRFGEKLKSNLGNAEFEDWIIGKGLRDMTRLIDARKRDPLIHLIKLLCKMSPSQEPRNSLCVLLSKYGSLKEGIDHEVSSLSVAVLTRIAKVTLPNHLSASLFQVLSGEVLEIICFIDKNMSASRINSERKNKFAKALLRGNGFRSIEAKILTKIQLKDLPSDLFRALKVIAELKDGMDDDIVKEEVRIITDFINSRGYETMRDLQDYMERLFSDMMNKFLVHFPNAIYREITECYLEEYEEKVRMALTLICRVEPLIQLVQWTFPTGTNIAALMTSDEFPSRNNKKAIESTSNNHTTSSHPPPPQVIDEALQHEDGTSYNMQNEIMEHHV